MPIFIGDHTSVWLKNGYLCFGDPRVREHYKVPKNLLPALVDALKELRLVSDPEPEPLKWYTVERHGQPEAGELCIVWTHPTSRQQTHRRASSDECMEALRYLPLDHLHGHSELPGWDEVAPAPEPELPEPWIAVDDEGESVGDFVAAYAWACDNGKIVLEQAAPSQSEPFVVAWCPIPTGQSVPPHPHAGKDENP